MWLDFQSWVRLLLALAFIIAGAALIILSLRADSDLLPQYFAREAFVIGCILVGTGAAVFVAGQRSESEKKGYRF